MINYLLAKIAASFIQFPMDFWVANFVMNVELIAMILR